MISPTTEGSNAILVSNWISSETKLKQLLDEAEGQILSNQ